MKARFAFVPNGAVPHRGLHSTSQKLTATPRRLRHPVVTTPRRLPHHRDHRNDRRIPVQAKLRAERETDARGFVLPQQGDVVVFQGRWPSEDEAGLVEAVQYVSARSVHIVDVAPLRRVSDDLFAVRRSAGRRGAARRKWLDVGEVRVVPDALYVATQDAYRVLGTRDGYAPVKAIDSAGKQAIDAEYRQLQTDMLRTTALAVVAGAVACVGVGRSDVCASYVAGGLASVLYLFLLQRAVDAVGEPASLMSRLLALRFAVPVLPFLLMAGVRGGGDAADSAGLLLGSLSKADAFAIVIGLLTYKAPLLWRTGGEFVDGLADIELGKTGMVGTVASLAARQVRKRRDGGADSDGDGAEDGAAGVASGDGGNNGVKPVFVFAGPSGVGKGTLMARLFSEYPTRFAYSVSHTTRAVREGEVNGRDYNFVSVDEFEDMISKGEFVEFANVHGRYYGTSFSAVDEVLRSGRVCVLDLDVQGVETVCGTQGLDWDARFIWIAPPSLEALEDRLRARGSETEETIKTRLESAVREMSFAATNNMFDFIVVNDDVDKAYSELAVFVNQECRQWDALTQREVDIT